MSGMFVKTIKQNENSHKIYYVSFRLGKDSREGYNANKANVSRYKRHGQGIEWEWSDINLLGDLLGDGQWRFQAMYESKSNVEIYKSE